MPSGLTSTHGSPNSSQTLAPSLLAAKLRGDLNDLNATSFIPVHPGSTDAT